MSQKLAAKVKARYHPRGNTHEVGPYLSASKLTGESAEDMCRALADSIHRGIHVNDTHFIDKPLIEYSFLGNTLGGEAFNYNDGWTASEFRCWVVPDDDLQVPKVLLPNATLVNGKPVWDMRGHPDAGAIEDGLVWFGEHKAHAEATPDKVEKAKRQDLLNLAMAWHMRQTCEDEILVIKPAIYTNPLMADHHTFHWPKGAKPGGIVLAVATWFGANIVESIPVTEKQLEEILAYYARKFRIIVEHALADKPELAKRDWDDIEGRQEFDLDLRLLAEPAGNVEEALKAERAAKAALDKAEKDSKAAKLLLEKALQEAGVWDRLITEKVSVGNYTVKRVQSTTPRRANLDKLVEDGLDAYIIPGKPYDYVKVS